MRKPDVSFQLDRRVRRRTYVGDPSKDVSIEADMVLADIQSPLDENFLLQSTSVI